MVHVGQWTTWLHWKPIILDAAQLTKTQVYLDNFSLRHAKGSYAADKPRPTDGSFGGQIVCGFAKFKGQLKKDGKPMWHCAYKFPFDYYALCDKKDKVLQTAFPEDYHVLVSKRSEGYSIKKMHYSGCPRWNYTWHQWAFAHNSFSLWYLCLKATTVLASPF